METKKPDEIDIEALLETLRPPSIPDEAFSSDNIDLYQIKGWKKNFAVSVLAGLSTEPAFHTNGIRLDWLQRLVFSKSEGRRKPQPDELGRALNSGLDHAKVLRLEDPNEDLFCDLIATPRGNYRVFSGQWEAAGPYTQTLLDAFEALPPGPQKQRALTSTYSLLTISDEVAKRANVHRLTPSAGEPKGLIAVPNIETLKHLARRVRFTNEELGHLGINKDALVPFFLEFGHFSYISAKQAGDTPLEFYPLLANPNGIIVASPAGISLAIRAVMVATAQMGGMDKLLLSAMLIEQQKYAEASAFWPVPYLKLPPPNQHFLRAAVCKFVEGRFLHIIQVPVTFDQFPQKAFASIRVLDDEASQAIADDVLRFWQFLGRQASHRESITALLLSGWGTPHRVSPPIDDSKAPKGWHFLPLSFADAAVLGACDNGKFRDICRILEQVERLEGEGFSLQNVNGILNLFGFWRSTNGNLIPEHMWEIEPPCNLMIPTDELFIPRIEAAKKRDLRALPFPDGTFKLVQREDWSDDDNLQSIYGSLADIAQGRLLGAIVAEERIWWIESLGEAGATKEWRYRIWHAALQWLGTVGPEIILRFPNMFPSSPARVVISFPARFAFEDIGSPGPDTSELAGTVIGSRNSDGKPASVQILPEWLTHLRRPENDAEIEFIAAILEQIATPKGDVISREKLCEAVRDAIGSSDWRWPPCP